MMKFLTVLIMVFLYRNWVGSNPVRAVVPFESFVAKLHQRVANVNIRYLLCVGLPVLLLWLVALEVHSWLFGLVWLALSLVTLVYAIDIIDTSALFDEQAQWLRRFASQDGLDEARTRQDDFRQRSVYEIFQGFYPALFWYLLLGPAGALLYILTRQYEVMHRDDPGPEPGRLVLYWLEWPAARVTGLVFALLGHFGNCFDEWLRTISDIREPIDRVLARFANSAVG
ncbi:MAG: regulatory signaling modulator protein AmpE, partial [Pseudomonadales bacterium]